MSDRSSQSWTPKTFGALARRLVNGGTPPTHISTYWNGTIPWITGADFTTSGLSEFRRFVSEDAVAHTATNVISKGELLLVTRTGVGKLAIAPCDVAISQDITGVYTDRNQVDTSFLFHRMRQGVEDLKKLNQGTSINGIVRRDLLDYPINLPPLPQQMRIAEILTTLDEAIDQTEALIAKTQAIKAGMMHDLFTRGITPDGQLRPSREEAPKLYKESPIGWIPNEWTVSALGKCLSGIDAGHSPECPDTPAKGEQWGVLKVGAVSPEEFREEENKTVLDPSLHNSALLVHAGDLLLSRANTVDLVGLVCYIDTSPRNLMLSDKTLRLKVVSSLVKDRFLFWSLQLPSLRRQIENAASGTSGSMKNISQRSVRALLFALPNLEEQTILVARMDATARAKYMLNQDLVKLQMVKSGLMHDLLTGRVRVPVDERERVMA